MNTQFTKEKIDARCEIVKIYISSCKSAEFRVLFAHSDSLGIRLSGGQKCRTIRTSRAEI